MDIVLEKIYYNPECFSKMVEDFKDYVEHTEPGYFQKVFDDLKKSANFLKEDPICEKIVTRNLERALAELKNDPSCYINDFYVIKKILESAEA